MPALKSFKQCYLGSSITLVLKLSVMWVSFHFFWFLKNTDYVALWNFSGLFRVVMGKRGDNPEKQIVMDRMIHSHSRNLAMYKVTLRAFFISYSISVIHNSRGRKKKRKKLDSFPSQAFVTYHHILIMCLIMHYDMEWNSAIYLESLGNTVSFSPVTSVYCHGLKVHCCRPVEEPPSPCLSGWSGVLDPAVLSGALWSFVLRMLLCDTWSVFIFRHLILSCQPWTWAWWKLPLVWKM